MHPRYRIPVMAGSDPISLMHALGMREPGNLGVRTALRSSLQAMARGGAASSAPAQPAAFWAMNAAAHPHCRDHPRPRPYPALHRYPSSSPRSPSLLQPAAWPPSRARPYQRFCGPASYRASPRRGHGSENCAPLCDRVAVVRVAVQAVQVPLGRSSSVSR